MPTPVRVQVLRSGRFLCTTRPPTIIDNVQEVGLSEGAKGGAFPTLQDAIQTQGGSLTGEQKEHDGGHRRLMLDIFSVKILADEGKVIKHGGRQVKKVGPPTLTVNRVQMTRPEGGKRVTQRQYSPHQRGTCAHNPF